MRRTRHKSGIGWHWLWSPDLRRWLHYEPDPPKGMPQAAVHKFWFKGRIKRGDAP